MPRTPAAREAATYLLLTYALATGIALALPHAGIAPLLSLLVPTVSVALISLRRGRAAWSGLGLRTAGWPAWPAAVLAPVGFLAVAYGTAVLLGFARLTGPGWSAADLVVTLVAGTVLILGEEIGWRGFLLPRARLVLGDRRRAAVATGFGHGLFHLPLILLTTTYDADGRRWVVAPVVVVTITGAGVFYAWLREGSGSLWPVAVAHNVANTVFDLGAAAAVTTTPAALAYTAGESGLATLVAVVGFALWLLRRPWDGAGVAGSALAVEQARH